MLTRRLQSLRHRQDATTIVTFALIAPAFLFLIFAIMDMGRVFNAWMVITNEAREAARYAAVNFDGTADPTLELAAEQTLVRNYVQQRLSGVLALSDMYRQPDVQFVPTGANQSPLIKVTIYYRVATLIPVFPTSATPHLFPIAAVSAMRGE